MKPNMPERYRQIKPQGYAVVLLIPKADEILARHKARKDPEDEPNQSEHGPWVIANQPWNWNSANLPTSSPDEILAGHNLNNGSQRWSASW